MAVCEAVGLRSVLDAQELRATQGAVMARFFTKNAHEACSMADALISEAHPDAVISIECPGANARGVYHNARGFDVSDLEAKQDALFDRICEMGALNIAIGDLGNEIGMGAIASDLEKHVPYARKGACQCGCGGGIAARTSADNLITATTSDWGCYGMIAALAYLMGDAQIMHDTQIEQKALTAGAEAGLIDMYGEHIPAIDGFSLELNLSVVGMMRELVVSTLAHTDRCTDWFDRVSELGYFDGK